MRIVMAALALAATAPLSHINALSFTGTIIGTVKDQTGTVVPGNNVSSLLLNGDGSVRNVGGYTEITQPGEYRPERHR